MKFTKIIAAALALLCGSAMLPKATVEIGRAHV